ncbi:MAG: ribonuclease HII [Candidatus Villigracilaceae bacterium]
MRDVPDWTLEALCWQAGLQYVAGMDEAGRGALAGPVSVGVVILPTDTALLRTLEGVRDSKQMTPLERARLAPRIRSISLAWAVGLASADEIDRLGIVCAVQMAGMRAVTALERPPDFLLCDFRLLLPELEIPQMALVKGDQKSLSIAAASVLAKTARDALLRELDAQYPGYGLARHKGYGTAAHRMAISRLGPTDIHRRSFIHPP